MTGALRRIVACLGLTALLSTPTLAAGPLCPTHAERVALETRVLQSELMVAALNCGYASHYNTFVKRFQPALASNGKALKAYFARSYGGGVKQLDSFVTQTANNASKVSMRQGQQFCSDLREAFDTLAKIDAKKLDSFVSTWPRASTHGQGKCVDQTIAKADVKTR